MGKETPMRVRIKLSESDMYIHNDTSGGLNNTAVVLLSNGSGSEGETEGNTLLAPGSGIVLVILVVLGTALNTFMVVAIVPNRKLRTVRNVLLVHLGCTGLLLTFLINLVSAVASFTTGWLHLVAPCQLYGYVLSVLTLVTAWTIAALSWDKYQTITSPLRHSFTATAVKMIVCFTVFWSVACTLSLPPLLGGSRFVFHPDKGICFICTRTIQGKVYLVVFILVAFYGPFGLMLYCYAHIFRIARTQSSRIAATMVRMTCVIQAPIAPTNQANNLSIKGTKAMYTIVQLIGAFVVLYVPFSVILLINISSDDFHLNETVTSSFTKIFLTSPVINAAVYGLRNKILRNSFHRYMRRKIRHYCYKDKRRGSVKSFRSSSFKATASRRHQNGNTSGLRRTQSFPVRGTRGRPKSPEETNQNGGLLVPEQLTRPHSFNVLNGIPSLPMTEEEPKHSADDA